MEEVTTRAPHSIVSSTWSPGACKPVICICSVSTTQFKTTKHYMLKNSHTKTKLINPFVYSSINEKIWMDIGSWKRYHHHRLVPFTVLVLVWLLIITPYQNLGFMQCLIAPLNMKRKNSCSSEWALQNVPGDSFCKTGGRCCVGHVLQRSMAYQYPLVIPGQLGWMARDSQLSQVVLDKQSTQ